MVESRSWAEPGAGPREGGVAFAGVADKPPEEEAFQPVVCVANIGPQQRRRRLRFGLGALSVGALAAVALVVLRVDVWWRLLLFVPFAAGGAGYFQAADHT